MANITGKTLEEIKITEDWIITQWPLQIPHCGAFFEPSRVVTECLEKHRLLGKKGQAVIRTLSEEKEWQVAMALLNKLIVNSCLLKDYLLLYNKPCLSNKGRQKVVEKGLILYQKQLGIKVDLFKKYPSNGNALWTGSQF